MTPRARTILENRWSAAGRPPVGWIWPAPTKAGHVNHSSVKKQHAKALKLSGVRPFVLYSLRHTFLTRLGESGCDAWTLARVAGHSSVAISSRYVHPSEDAVLAAISRLSGHNSGHIGNLAEPTAKSGETRIPADSNSYMVSADGLEPSTHALKGQRLRVLPRGTKHLQYQTTVPFGAKHPQSAVNLQLIYILAPGLISIL
jgi:hypothetical protein